MCGGQRWQLLLMNEWTAVGGLAALLLLARYIVPFAVVYRRNNLAPVVALLLFASGLHIWDWLGVVAFTLGTLLGALQWTTAISRANESLMRHRSRRYD
jgi:hypothetical protein